MRKSLLPLLLLTSMLFVSCLENNETVIEEETCTKENFTVSFDKQIKRMLIEPTNWLYSGKTIDFSYNEFNLLEKIEKGNIDSYHLLSYAYKCNNNLNVILNYGLTFNEENKLSSIRKINSFGTYELIHNGNTITVTGDLHSNTEQQITLYTNSNNLITKIEREDNYSLFNYDANGNMTNAKDYDLNDVLLKEYDFTFDQNPNPFYGQLTSAYLERMLYFFYDSVNGGIQSLAFRSDFDISFPYFKNNLIKITETSKSGPYNVTMLREFTYDTDNYPTKYEYTVVGYHESTVSITYK